MARKEENSQLNGAASAPTKLSMIVGENLRQLRRKQGLSLEQLAAVSGVSRAMLGQIETGKSAPTINLLGRIAEALKVSVSGLISSPGAR
ncbi:MAG TPA: helix-turn-helix transcriptional regulator, partial [Hyphomicrobium sp.]|nr:helix-turn-helix transcriptional regulator [Hyphomicrobium sp.]